MKHTLARRLGALASAAVLAGVLVGCGSDDNGSSGDSHNDADIAFATDMIPHHAQAVEMAELVDGKDVDPEVQQLAADIEAAQAPEIKTMTGWLEDWDEDVPDTSTSGMDHGGMDSSSDMPGMMSEDDMTALAAAGAEFQTMWLTMMTEHHQGAIEMAQAEQEDGEYEPAITLAGEIESAQSDEITLMEDLLARS